MPATGPPPDDRPPDRGRLRPLERPRSRRLLLAAVALAAFAAGTVAGARDEPRALRVARAYAAAWERQDFRTMHDLLAPADGRRISTAALAATYRRAAITATAAEQEAGEAHLEGDEVLVAMRVRTRIFGTLSLPLRVRVDEAGGKARVAWRPELAFPGLRPGERLTRTTRLPPRATIEARDGTPLAEGEARTTQLGPLAGEIAGRLGPAPPERAAEVAARGVPPGAPVGLTGLEREFDARLAGTPGGELRAGRRVLARSAPRTGTAVRTSIDADLQRAAATALAGRYGGIAAVRPRDGEVLALVGVAASAPQPPGSTFKIITLAGALESGVVRPGRTFPVQTATTLEGVRVENANGEACGGTLRRAFALSCNSVFAPLGAELGARRLVATAERFGFNEEPTLTLAARSTLPAAAEIGDELAVGSTAIGQGKVLATALQMASVAGTIAHAGAYARPTLLAGDAGRTTRAVSARTAREVGRAMRAVVTSGTGVGAALPGVAVAGKTGTAELRSTVSQDPLPGDSGPSAQDTTDTDAWFAAFAPYPRPRVALAVLLVGQGAGGATAAPVARQVLAAAVG
jgi:cell division protein FtsI/penicillin-binding protein 2